MAIEMDDAKIGIIVGVVIGILLIVIFIAVLIQCYCRSRKRKHTKMTSSLRNGSHLTRPSPLKFPHSKSNFHAHNYVDKPIFEHGSLPKVGSSGLWLTRTSMLGPTASLAYPDVPHTALLRATSEPRLAGPTTMYENNMHVYQSQQMPPLFEVYEPWQTRDVMTSRQQMGSSHDQGTYYPPNRQYVHVQPSVMRDPYLSDPETSMFQRNRILNHANDVTDSTRAHAQTERLQSPQIRSNPVRGIVQVHNPVSNNYSNRPWSYTQQPIPNLVSRPNVEGRPPYNTRPSSYNDNFLLRENRSQSVADGLDRVLSSGGNDIYAKPNRRQSSDSGQVVNKRDKKSNKNSATKNGVVRKPNDGFTNSGFQPDETQNGDYQNGTSTTLTSGYDSARSRLVNDVHSTNYNGMMENCHISQTEVFTDSVKNADDLVNNNVIHTHSHPLYKSQTTEQTDLEAKRVTTKAFKFLENYLSDDDTSVTGSDLVLDNTTDTLVESA